MIVVGTAQAEDVVVVQKDKAFSRRIVTLVVGDRLVFKNEDSVIHHTYSLDADFIFSSIRQKPGGDTSIVMNSPGTATIRCGIHPRMKLVVNVKQSRK